MAIEMGARIMVWLALHRKPLQMNRLRCTFGLSVLAVASAGWLAGCISRQAEPLIPGEARPRPFQTPPKRVASKRTLDLQAQARGNMVSVTVLNLSRERSITLGPKMFAVVVGGRIYPADAKGVIGQFPIKTIAPEEGVTGRFIYHQFGSLVGKQLILNCPGTGVFRTTIQPDAGSVVRPAVRPRTTP